MYFDSDHYSYDTYLILGFAFFFTSWLRFRNFKYEVYNACDCSLSYECIKKKSAWCLLICVNKAVVYSTVLTVESFQMITTC